MTWHLIFQETAAAVWHQSLKPPETPYTSPQPPPLHTPLPHPPSRRACPTHVDQHMLSRLGFTFTPQPPNWDPRTHRWEEHKLLIATKYTTYEKKNVYEEWCSLSDWRDSVFTPSWALEVRVDFWPWCYVVVYQRQPSQLRRPSSGRGPQLTPGIATMVRNVVQSVWAGLYLLTLLDVMVYYTQCVILFIQKAYSDV